MSRRAEAVLVVEKRFGYFPKRFCWRGHCFEVVRVQRVWCTARSWPRPAQSRRYALLTKEGAFELQHDLVHDLWSVRHAPETLAAAPFVKRSRARGESYGSRLVVVR